MRTLTITGGAIASILALTLSACSDSDEAPDSPDARDPDVGVLEALFEAAEAESFSSGTDAAQSMRVEELIAECMADEGFEYVPVDYSDLWGWQTAEEVPDYGTLEYAKSYGYGVTTGPGDDEAFDVEWTNPNDAIRDALSANELEAYLDRLWGNDPRGVGPEGTALPWQEQGCQGWAEHEVYGHAMRGSLDDESWEWNSLVQEIERVFSALDTHPDVGAAAAGWSDCVADAGYPGFTAVPEAEASVSDRYDALLSGDVPQDPAETAGGGLAAVEASFDEHLAALTEEEIALATADFTCREESGYQDVYDEVSAQAQQEFYDAHRAEVDAFLEDQFG